MMNIIIIFYIVYILKVTVIVVISLFVWLPA